MEQRAPFLSGLLLHTICGRAECLPVDETWCRSQILGQCLDHLARRTFAHFAGDRGIAERRPGRKFEQLTQSLRHLLDRKSTRLNSSHLVISYAVFCLKKE